MAMDLENDFDFTIVSDNIFQQNNADVKLYFDITWNDKSSRLIINCREVSRRGVKNSKNNKIKSFTIQEFKDTHKELSSIEPMIQPYFPNEINFKLLEIEYSNFDTPWRFFRRASTSIVKEEKELTDETIEAIKFYLNTIADICGHRLLFSVVFKEDNTVYFEDQELFIRTESEKNIEKRSCECKRLLGRHDEAENLQSLTEDLYIQEDLAFESYKDALYTDSLMASLPLIEESENIKEKLENILIELQLPDIGPKKVSELTTVAVEHIQQYYGLYRQILKLKINVAKKKMEIYLKYISKMIEDKQKYQRIIFRDCAGDRLRNLSNEFHKENEKIAQLNLDFHSAKEIILARKIELIRCWKSGQEMVRVSIRHEDVSLIQLKHLDPSNLDRSKVDQHYSYIKETYNLLLAYTESQRLGLENRKHSTDDPLSVILPSSKKPKGGGIAVKLSKKEAMPSVDYSWVINQDGDDSDFEDALDEEDFSELKKYELGQLAIKTECESKLKEIANKRAELRNSKARLENQYDKLMEKMLISTNNSTDSLQLESLHPENIKLFQKPAHGTFLTPEERKAEAKRARERIKQYQEKLKVISEDNYPEQIKPVRKLRVSSIRNLSSVNPKILEKKNVIEISSVTMAPPPSPITAPPPPPITAPPPPPPLTLPSTISTKQYCIRKSVDFQNDGLSKRQCTNYLEELQMAFARKNEQKLNSLSIDETLFARKLKPVSQLNDTISSLIDSRRQFFTSPSQENSDDEID